MINEASTFQTAWPCVVAGAAVVVGTAAYGAFSPRSSMFAPLIWKGDSATSSQLAMTFDDGPHPDITPQILSRLKEMNTKAAFFLVGQTAERYPDVVRMIHDDGHLIGNHSFDHASTGLFHGVNYWLDQLRRTDDVLFEITGEQPRLFRPPMGFKHHRVGWAIQQTGHAIVTWSRRSFDGVKTSPQKIVQRLVANAVAGDILLMHDGAPPKSSFCPHATVEVLPQVIEGLQQRGMSIVRLDELIKPQLSN